MKKRLFIMIVIVGMLIGAGGCKKKEVKPPTPITPTKLVAKKHGIWWKIGYIPAKAVHELGSGVWYGIWGSELEKD